MQKQLKRISLLCASFIGFMLISTTIGSLLLHQYGEARDLEHLLNHYSFPLIFVHTAAIVSIIWWWPLYIKHRASLHAWSDENVIKAINLKWHAFVILMLIDLLFLLS